MQQQLKLRRRKPFYSGVMPHNVPSDGVSSWLLLGPELAGSLFLLLGVYTFALLAATANGGIPGLGWLARRSIYNDLVVGLGLLACVPAIGLALVLTSRAAEQREVRAAELLQASASRVVTSLDEFVGKHRSGIASLASSIERAGRVDVASMTEWLTSHHAIYNDYLTMLAADSSGDIVTATTMVQGRPERIATLAHNISDREYFSIPMQNGGVYVSEVFQGRGLGTGPIIAVSAPVRAPGGALWGIVEGSLNLQALSRFRPSREALGQDADLIILDHRDRVIYSTHPERRLTMTTVDIERLREPDPLQIIAHRTSAAGWQVIETVERAPIHSQIWPDVRIAVLWLAATILVAVLLSAAIARRVTRPLTELIRGVRALDLEGTEADMSPPPGAPREIRDVFDCLGSMSERLHNSHRQLTAAVEAGKHYREQLETTLARREGEIRSRTQELEHTNRELRTLSNVDQLTGLANRRKFIEMLDRVWRHCLREKETISIVISDVDHFKAYNDTYGHQAGDACLAKIGGALSACVWRPLDFVARYGGEEFIMILPNTEFSDALDIAERTRRVIEELGLQHRGSPPGFVTLSLGVASATPGRDSHYDELIQRADVALYHAKAAGRNRVGYSEGEKIVIHCAEADTVESTGMADPVVALRRPGEH